MTKRPRPRVRAVAAVLAPLAILLALLSWGLSSPPGSSPDDDYHLASIWCAAGEVDGRCEAATDPDERFVPPGVRKASVCYAFRSESAACPLAEGEMIAFDRGNWLTGAYPPVFYAVMNLFVTEDVAFSVVLMRSANAVLYVGVLTALFFLLPRQKRPPLVWGAAVTAVPLAMFLIPSVNPSSWAVLSATGLWVAVWGFMTTPGRRAWLLAGLAGLLLLLGAGARSDAAVYGVIAMLAGATIAVRRDRAYVLRLLVPAGLSVVAALFFFTAGQSAVVSAGTAAGDQGLAASTLVFANLKALPELWAGVFGTSPLGWLDTEMPGAVWVTALTLFGAVVFWGLRSGTWGKWVALAGVAASLTIIPLYILVHDGVVAGEGGVQSRYVYPLVIMLAGIALVGGIRPDLGLSRLQMIVAACSLVLANGVALHVNIRRYVTGDDVLGVDLDANVEWWWNAPVSPMALWAAGSVAFLVGIAALTFAAWRPRIEPTHTGVS
ncbi:DUF2142 domain-containing protein [Microbacterium atlanticum]|uniref:DUF2142 domain-containing protein n=1 Tax=Microbacterium atlanticum TaxID=2782168 RepID=UPI0018895D95|nr:DUF2142 domain-containing protein [Microbacterium atlanticum]